MNEVIKLEDEQQLKLDALVKDARRNKVEAQRFAIEASKLVSTTVERLNAYKDRGFFKKCWYAVSGKRSELIQANEGDLIEMQKFAWAYLSKLQEQNLIEARAIAVIRSNLKELQNEISELHDMIAVIVDKFDARLEKLEGRTALIDWLVHVEVEQSFDKSNRLIFFLQLVFDCLRVLRENKISLEQVSIRKDIAAALNKFKDVFGDAHRLFTVDDFIRALYDEVQQVGFEKFRQIIDLDVDGNPMTADYILANVAGAGYTALYEFENEMVRNENLAAQISNAEDRDQLRLGAVSKILTNGQAQYTLDELGREIVGGSLIAEEAYRDEHGMQDVVSTMTSKDGFDEAFDIGDVLGDFVSLSEHAFLKTSPNEDEKKAYIESFALVYASIGGCVSSDYLLALGKLFNCQESVECVKTITDILRANPRNADVQSDMRNNLRVMVTPARKFAWCIDAMMLGYEQIARTKTALSKIMCKAFRFTESDAESFLNNVETLVVDKDDQRLLSAIEKINAQSDAWRAIVEYRGLKIEDKFKKRDVQFSDNEKTETLRLQLAEVAKFPFLVNEVKCVVSCNGFWFVCTTHYGADGRQYAMWRSEDGNVWESIRIPCEPDLDDLYVRTINDGMVVWDKYANPRKLWWSKDGITFNPVDATGVDNYIEDVFSFNGKVFVRVAARREYRYKSGLFIKSDETMGYNDSAFYVTDTLEVCDVESVAPSKWVKVQGYDNLKEGRFVQGSSLCASRDRLFGISYEEGWYAHNKWGRKGYDDHQASIVFADADKRWCEASLDSRLPDGTSNDYFWGRVGDMFLFTIKTSLATKSNIYASQGGMAWRTISTTDGIFTPFFNVGKYLCTFGVSGEYKERKAYMYLTADGLNLQKLPIEWCPYFAGYKDGKFLLMNGKKLFVGELLTTRM